jgi:hypothetical protein
MRSHQLTTLAAALPSPVHALLRPLLHSLLLVKVMLLNSAPSVQLPCTYHVQLSSQPTHGCSFLILTHLPIHQVFPNFVPDGGVQETECVMH